MIPVLRERPSSAEPIIHVRDLTKVFERPIEPQGRFTTIRRLFSRATTRKVAVKDVSFDIAAGELVGYLGANGAGM